MTGEEGAVSEATDGLRLLTPVSVEEELRHRITNLESSIHAHHQLTERFKRQRDAARAEAAELREAMRTPGVMSGKGEQSKSLLMTRAQIDDIRMRVHRIELYHEEHDLDSTLARYVDQLKRDGLKLLRQVAFHQNILDELAARTYRDRVKQSSVPPCECPTCQAVREVVTEDEGRHIIELDGQP